MLYTLKAVKAKLSFYYKETDKMHSDIFVISIIIALLNKL